jgi:hypothetical protein
MNVGGCHEGIEGEGLRGGKKVRCRFAFLAYSEFHPGVMMIVDTGTSSAQTNNRNVRLKFLPLVAPLALAFELGESVAAFDGAGICHGVA